MAPPKRKPPLGQHFLRDQAALARIAEALTIEPGAVVVEIGPGEGALTEHLLRQGARVTALEIDPRLAGKLRERFAGNPSLEIIEADVLAADLAALAAGQSQTPVKVAGNLPYYITSPILRRVFAAGEVVSTAVFLVQKEVALRITAGKGSRDYGYLSVLCELHAGRELLFTVPPGAFRPPPKVTSAVVRLVMRPEIDVPEKLLAFLKSAFRQPRKTLLNNLSGMYERSRLAGLPESRLRAQEMSLAELRALWRKLEEAR
jgi:16S rRNA (adenine1518-N6/adenine1519-N6)-dimethyltransferase